MEAQTTKEIRDSPKRGRPRKLTDEERVQNHRNAVSQHGYRKRALVRELLRERNEAQLEGQASLPKEDPALPSE